MWDSNVKFNPLENLSVKTIGRREKRPDKLSDLIWYHAFYSASTSVVKGKPISIYAA